MKNGLYIFLLFGGLIYSSCTDVDTLTTLDDKGGGEYVISLNIEPILQVSEMASSVEEEVEGDMGSDPFKEFMKYFDRPVDTTSSLYNGLGADYFKDFTAQEKNLAKKIQMRVSNQYLQDSIMVFLSSSFADGSDRYDQIALLNKAFSERNPSASSDVLRFINPEMKYDPKGGLLKIGEVTLNNSDTIYADPDMGGFDELFGEGGYRFIYKLPGKIMSVSNPLYKKLDDETLEYFIEFTDLFATNSIEGATIRFLPTKKITDPKVTEVWEPEPKEVLFKTENNVPSDAIVLFDGTNTDEWVTDKGKPIKWTVEDGVLTVNPGTGSIYTKRKWGDVQLHIEWKSPDEPTKEGQDKGNSGVFFQKKYEVQILNSYRNRTYSNGQAAAIYKQKIPLVNATKPTGEWNVYDIIYRAPQYDSKGIRTKKGNVTVIHNGVIVQDHVDIEGTVEYIGLPKVIPHGDDQLMLQDHSNKVSFRNIWIREL